MNAIKLARSNDQYPVTDPVPQVRATTAAARPLPRRDARQMCAMIVIVAAWVIGTLVSELNVMGAELVQQPGPLARSHESMRDLCIERETEFALTLSGIQQLERVQRDSRMRHVYERIIELNAQAEPETQVATKKETQVAAEPETKVATPPKKSQVAAKPASGPVVPPANAMAKSDSTALKAGETKADETKAAATKRDVSKKVMTPTTAEASDAAVAMTKEAPTVEASSVATNRAGSADLEPPASKKAAEPTKLATTNERTTSRQWPLELQREESPAKVALPKPTIVKARTAPLNAEKVPSKQPVVTETAAAPKQPIASPVVATDRPGKETDASKTVELALAETDDDDGGMIDSQQVAEFAWKGFPEGSIPGIVERVVHSFSELMTPVHVRPYSSDVVRPDEQGSVAKSPISFVERNAASKPDQVAVVPEVRVAEFPSAGVESQEELSSLFAADGPLKVEADPRVMDAEDSVSLTGPLKATPDPRARIVRMPPQLLHVAEQPSMMLPAPAHRQERRFNAPVNNSEPYARLAAKWPFERAATPVNSSGVSLNVDQADVRTVFEMLARGYQLNILVAPDVEGVVTANVEGLSPEQTLSGIVKMCGLNMQHESDSNLIYIYPSDRIPVDARQLRVFTLDYARAATLEPTVQGLLSPVGNAYINSLDTQDNHKTEESIVVVDIPAAIAQVESFIVQADRAPRQVLIEARVLEVELTDDMVHGINFDAFVTGDLNVGGFGFADTVASASNPMFFARIEGAKINGLLDLLETTTDSKTLASPRVQVVNGQHARIQVGQQLGYTVATVTQTSTIQDVQFLDTGVVLNVTPTISRDNRILMEVKPEVSDGVINPDTLLPEEETREVETSVLLDNHQGVIIGGLIQERDRTVVKKLPWLGDVKHIGKFFQRREATRSRTEIIVALIPHIVERGVVDERSAIEYERADTPLLWGPLQRTCRPWEPRLPDVAGDERHFDVNTINRRIP